MSRMERSIHKNLIVDAIILVDLKYDIQFLQNVTVQIDQGKITYNYNNADVIDLIM